MTGSTSHVSAKDYIAAVQHPGTAFKVARLRNAEFPAGLLGVPTPFSGSAAVVFKARLEGQSVALRFYIRPQVSSAQRYRKLMNHCRAAGLSDNIATTRWHDNAVVISGQSWPVLEMEWIEGQTLRGYLDDLVDENNVEQIAQLALQWEALVTRLQRAEFAHGDLSGDNVLVDRAGALRLVDFDGCWCPALARSDAPREVGNPAFQHPRRTWGQHMDTFPGLVILTSLYALAESPGLWNDGWHDQTNLLFKPTDLADTDTAIWSTLAALKGDELQRTLSRLQSAVSATQPPDASLQQFMIERSTSNARDESAWWSEYEADETAHQGQAESKSRSSAGNRSCREMYEEALRADKQGRLAGAEKLLIEVIDGEFDSDLTPRAMQRLGILFRKQHRYKEAQTMFQRARETHHPEVSIAAEGELRGIAEKVSSGEATEQDETGFDEELRDLLNGATNVEENSLRRTVGDWLVHHKWRRVVILMAVIVTVIVVVAYFFDSQTPQSATQTPQSTTTALGAPLNAQIYDAAGRVSFLTAVPSWNVGSGFDLYTTLLGRWTGSGWTPIHKLHGTLSYSTRCSYAPVNWELDTSAGLRVAVGSFSRDGDRVALDSVVFLPSYGTDTVRLKANTSSPTPPDCAAELTLNAGV